MRKSGIVIVIGIMSIALVGIIIMQINWIRHDFILREQQFDQQVNEVMNNVVDKIETRQAFNLISHRFFNLQNDSGFWKTIDSSLLKIPDGPDKPLPPDLSGHLFAEDKLLDNSFELSGQNIKQPPGPELSVLDKKNHLVIADSIRTNDRLRKEKISISSDSSNTATEINRIRVDEQLIKKDRMEIENEMMEAEVEKQRVRIEQELIKMKVKINSKMGKLSEVWNQLAMSYVTGEENPFRSIPPSLVDSVLQKELKNHGIGTAYNFAIIDSKKDSVIAIKDSSETHQLKSSAYAVELFPNEIISRGQMLHLYFPGRLTFVLSSLSWMLAGSALFTFTIIFVFFYTISMLMKQKELSDIKSDFINNMTHEFKTPIATISLAIDAINNPKISENREKVLYYSNIVRQENKRMNQQVETILQTALFEKKDFKLHKKDIDLHELVHRIVANLMVQVESRGGSIRLALNARHTMIHADEVLLTTAIINLLDNANKYSPDQPDITLSTSDREEGVLIAVEDKGMGMDKETMSRIFEKFYRQPTGNIHNVKGFGLGLSNVKSIVKAHGGEIKVTSKPGEGSRFEIYIPSGNQPEGEIGSEHA